MDTLEPALICICLKKKTHFDFKKKVTNTYLILF